MVHFLHLSRFPKKSTPGFQADRPDDKARGYLCISAPSKAAPANTCDGRITNLYIIFFFQKIECAKMFFVPRFHGNYRK